MKNSLIDLRHRLRQELKHLSQEESDAKWTELVLSCEADRMNPSLFWQRVRKDKGNEQEENKDIKDKDNRIRLYHKGKE